MESGFGTYKRHFFENSGKFSSMKNTKFFL